MDTLPSSLLSVDAFHPDRPEEQVRLLLVGPDMALRNRLRDRLNHPRWSIREAQSGSEALEKLMQEGSEVMLLDPQLPDLDADEFQSMIRSQYPEVQIVTLSVGAEESAPKNSATGDAYHLAEIMQQSRLSMRREAPAPRISLSRPAVGTQRGWQGMTGSSAVMQRVFHSARLVARHDTTVLIQGESGTGKDLLARAIHVSSPREKQPFVVINCAAIPEPLLEAELFGYTKGSFTGAAQSRIGRIHAAHGGSLFLDEIGEMPYPLQSKILRFLEQGEVQRIGSVDTLKVDCRVIAATNADLKKAVKANQFREDLYYRLAVFPIQLPPLRDRMDDLEALIEGFLQRFCPGVGLSPAARRALIAHDWPGNIRELRNVLERASLFADGRSEIQDEDIVF